MKWWRTLISKSRTKKMYVLKTNDTYILYLRNFFKIENFMKLIFKDESNYQSLANENLIIKFS